MNGNGFCVDLVKQRVNVRCDIAFHSTCCVKECILQSKLMHDFQKKNTILVFEGVPDLDLSAEPPVA